MAYVITPDRYIFHDLWLYMICAVIRVPELENVDKMLGSNTEHLVTSWRFRYGVCDYITFTLTRRIVTHVIWECELQYTYIR
jgi:hypothetical protein